MGVGTVPPDVSWDTPWDWDGSGEPASLSPSARSQIRRNSGGICSPWPRSEEYCIPAVSGTGFAFPEAAGVPAFAEAPAAVSETAGLAVGPEAGSFPDPEAACAEDGFRVSAAEVVSAEGSNSLPVMSWNRTAAICLTVASSGSVTVSWMLSLAYVLTMRETAVSAIISCVPVRRIVCAVIA